MWIDRKYFIGYHKGCKDTANKVLKYLSQYDDNDLIKIKYIRQLLKEDEDESN